MGGRPTDWERAGDSEDHEEEGWVRSRVIGQRLKARVSYGRGKRTRNSMPKSRGKKSRAKKRKGDS